MNKASLESEVRNFYEGQSLPEDRVDAILAADEFAAASRRWKRVAAASVGMAAILLLSIGFYLNTSQRVVGNLKQDEVSSVQPSPVIVPADMPKAVPSYRLVAFRSHGDACPHCSDTGKVYRQLAAELRDEPIDIEQFDLSQPAQSETISRRLQELGLSSLIEGRIETAFLALVDSDGNSIQEFKPSLRCERIAKEVRKLVTLRPSSL